MPLTATPLILIEGAWYTMGSASGADDERPPHRVWIDPIMLAEAPVTNFEYAAFLQATSNEPPSSWADPLFNHPQQPVVAVSWFDAVSYCQWRSAIEGRYLRLPSEAEWELAARGGIHEALYPWGNEPPQSRAGYGTRWRGGPEPVRSGSANAFGIYDLCENVHEWCSDWYASDYYAVSPDRNPAGPETGSRRASRGGSWRHQIKISRCSARSSITPSFRYVDYGFRLATRAF